MEKRCYAFSSLHTFFRMGPSRILFVFVAIFLLAFRRIRVMLRRLRAVVVRHICIIRRAYAATKLLGFLCSNTSALRICKIILKRSTSSPRPGYTIVRNSGTKNRKFKICLRLRIEVRLDLSPEKCCFCNPHCELAPKFTQVSDVRNAAEITCGAQPYGWSCGPRGKSQVLTA